MPVSRTLFELCACDIWIWTVDLDATIDPINGKYAWIARRTTQCGRVIEFGTFAETAPSVQDVEGLFLACPAWSSLGGNTCARG